MIPEFPISLREYARYIGCNLTIIRRAIQSGKIPNQAIKVNVKNSRPMIIPSIAEKLWGFEYKEKRKKRTQ